MKSNNTPSTAKLNPARQVRDSVKASPTTSFGATLAKKSAELQKAEEEEAVVEAVGVELLRNFQNQPKATPLSDEKSDDDGGEGW